MKFFQYVSDDGNSLKTGKIIGHAVLALVLLILLFGSLGTINAGGTVLTRTTILTSSNSDTIVTFTSGTKDVFCTLPASKAVYLDSTGAPVGAASNGFAVAMAIAL